MQSFWMEVSHTVNDHAWWQNMTPEPDDDSPVNCHLKRQIVNTSIRYIWASMQTTHINTSALLSTLVFSISGVIIKSHRCRMPANCSYFSFLLKYSASKREIQLPSISRFILLSNLSTLMSLLTFYLRMTTELSAFLVILTDSVCHGFRAPRFISTSDICFLSFLKKSNKCKSD